MSEIKFESKGEKLYVVKLDDTAIGRLFKNKEGFWKISLGVLDDQDLYSLLNSLNQEPCKCRAWERTMKNKRQPLYNKDEFCKLLGLPAKKFWQIKKNPFFPESRFLGKKEYWEKDKAWTRDENVLTVSLSSGKYMEFKDFPESEWKRLRETLGFTEEKERE